MSRSNLNLLPVLPYGSSRFGGRGGGRSSPDERNRSESAPIPSQHRPQQSGSGPEYGSRPRGSPANRWTYSPPSPPPPASYTSRGPPRANDETISYVEPPRRGGNPWAYTPSPRPRPPVHVSPSFYRSPRPDEDEALCDAPSPRPRPPVQLAPFFYRNPRPDEDEAMSDAESLQSESSDDESDAGAPAALPSGNLAAPEGQSNGKMAQRSRSV
ncbi:hypothetical protein DFH06DRAFT_570083 [Mycena polygramma]|nr:hypothetical protein DFH06DRAFT_570083 [Mycena polygramma]